MDIEIWVGDKEDKVFSKNKREVENEQALPLNDMKNRQQLKPTDYAYKIW